MIAIDGKTVRGARGKAGKAPHLVAALAHGIGAVLGQVAVDEKIERDPRGAGPAEAFADLAGAVITLDAMHAQHDTAKAILSRGADYVMTVKANMPTLYRQLKKLPWAAVPASSAVTTATAAGPAAPSRSCWRRPGSSSRAPPRSRSCAAPSPGTARRPSRSSTSSPATATPAPATLAAWVHGHWEIENRLHWVRSPGAGLAVASCGADATRMLFSC